MPINGVHYDSELAELRTQAVLETVLPIIQAVGFLWFYHRYNRGLLPPRTPPKRARNRASRTLPPRIGAISSSFSACRQSMSHCPKPPGYACRSGQKHRRGGSVWKEFSVHCYCIHPG
ncbi:hypothetical protein L596_021369 [Steinernema carpocapsae]|uniref:Uncharacterized protein n=1 Tax=Steinernema carpocapsae TaxID=34508 RepID=A0A4U5MJD4_STECR|nr:hypothetical protein L596_021369 [Steinernema carpocapsae]